ncbi:MAG TPA: LON peptidase substrate-binding domain-containing protein [Opitutaceae bacterium]|nr:LON peptidase substrate-binding domain-containing protein [Opitutaceae bacterium]
MELEIRVPDEVPVMTLPNVAFFPQALLPLHIFEPRYRHMLRDVLSTNRIFAVACLDSKAAASDERFEPPHRVACIGLVRACQENGNGTSNLLLQGLCRVAIESIVGDEPYRRVRIRALSSEPGAAPVENAKLRTELAGLIQLKLKLSPGGSDGMTDLLRSVEDPEVFADIAAFNLCDNVPAKQRLLETLDVNRRLVILQQILRTEIDAIVLHARLQGGLPNDQIPRN